MTDHVKKLIDQYNQPPKGETKRVRGTVESIETMTGMMILHLNTGASFALALEELNDDEQLPLPGDYVQGVTNPFANPVDIFGDKHMQIFDFENVSGGERKTSFDFFRKQAPK